ncbi:hypothetical protein ACSLOO_28220, partial [Klebsiella pneumoniae]
CSEKNNLLPDGPSTEKERKLLESVNREELLTLYPGTKASGNKTARTFLKPFWLLNSLKINKRSASSQLRTSSFLALRLT